MQVKNRTMLTVVALLAVVGASLGIFVSQNIRQAPRVDMTQFHGTWLDKPREVSAFELHGVDNLVFNQDSLKGHWTMMFFGFTSCPSICPVTMAELGKMVRLLDDSGVKPLPEVVLVSLDPERDSVEKLHQYVTAFNSHFYGLKGASEEAVKLMAQEIGIAYTKVAALDEKEQKNYTIEHTGTVMLFNPQGKLCAFFTMPHQAQLLADDYQLAMKMVRV